MCSEFSPGRRGFLEIVECILTGCKTGAKKTKLMYAANLNWVQLNRYLRFLTDRGFIRHLVNRNEYFLTEKGVELLRICESLRKMLS